jgi:hypothetical protein
MPTPVTQSMNTELEKSRSESVKFKQQMALGIGGAMVFGLVGAVGNGLIGVVLGTTTISFLGPLGAAIGLGVLAVAGITSIFLGSKFMAESIRMDQESQARKIGKLTSLGVAPVITPNEPASPGKTTPPGMSGFVASEAAETTPSHHWAERVGHKPHQPMAHARAQDEAWGDKVRTAEASASAPTLH